MKLKVNLAWKLVVNAPEEGVNYCSANKHFNIKTGKTFINKLGGISSLDFFPYTFEPTNVFYHAIEACKIENAFVGKKLPFEGNVLGVIKPVKIKIHRYTSDLVLISVSVNQIEFNGDINDLQEIMSIETHREIYNLVRVISSIISSGGKKSDPIQRKLKTYPYIELESSDDRDFVEDEKAVELLTRHKNPKREIVESVISKNNDHQLDRNNILIDRQGILARYFSDIGEYQSIQRKFESSHYLFELAISLSNIFDSGAYSNLTTEQKDSITKLIKNPTVVFTKSVTAFKTWMLLLDEFKLNELYELVISSNEEVGESKIKEWSDLKKWSMGILGVLLIGITSIIYEENQPFANDTVSLVHPLDDTQFNKKNENIRFYWKGLENVKKYILFIERNDSKNNKWLPLENRGRIVVSHTSESIVINENGRFKWKVVARNNEEETIAESVWYFFIIKSKTAPNKKIQPTKKN